MNKINVSGFGWGVNIPKIISRPKWITLKLCQTRAKGKKNVCTRAHVLPFRRAQAGH